MVIATADMGKNKEGDSGSDQRIPKKRKTSEKNTSDDNNGTDSDAKDRDVRFQADIPMPKKTKLTKSNLYKAPTNEELNSLKETEMLFQSSLFRLQITELLSEVMLKQKKKDSINSFIAELKETLEGLNPGKEFELSNTKWIKKLHVEFPINQEAPPSKGKFKFCAPKSVKVNGSFKLDLALKPHPHIDLRLEMPKECFQPKDYLNQRYLRKRALYLMVLAKRLRSCDLVGDISFTYHHGNHMRPLLVVTPTDGHGKGFSVRLHPYPEEGSLRLSRFHVTTNNIRRSWYQQDQLTEDVDSEGTEPITPHYNNWVLQDLVHDMNLGYAEHVFADYKGVRMGIALLKVWLHQRQLDQGPGCFSGYIMMMYVLYLLSKRKLSTTMSSYQVMRNTLLHLSQSNWDTEGISLAPETEFDPNRPLLADFLDNFDIVFVDRTGYLNLCADMCKSTWDWVKHEALLSLKALETTGVDGFHVLFMTPVHFLDKFDYAFHIHNVSALSHCIRKNNLATSVLDRCGDVVSVCLPFIQRTLKRALGDRVHLVSRQLHPSKKWSVDSNPPDANDVTLTFGLLINPDKAYNIVERGPSAESSEAEKFREFWGEASELRRFQDGAICEAVLWKSETMADRRKIVAKIIRHVLSRHVGLSRQSVLFRSGPLDPLLTLVQPSRQQSKVLYGTGEEQILHIHRCYDELGKKLRSLQDLPLTIHTIQGISPVLRYTEVFPPMPVNSSTQTERVKLNVCLPTENKRPPPFISPIEVVCLLEASGKWPDDKDAIQRVKAAFLIKIAELLRTDHSLTCQMTREYLDVYQDGFVFRVSLGYMKEISLHKMVVTAEGMVKMVETEQASALQHRLVTLPQITSTLHGIQQQNNTFSCAVRLAKRWLSSHMLLGGHMSEEAVELIMTHLYITPAPYTSPGSPLVGFLRFLRLLSTHNWQTTPLIVNLNDKLTAEDYAEIQTRFTRDRATLPLMFISTPSDKFSSPWSRHLPTLQVLQRVILLAHESLTLLQQQLSTARADIKQIFRPPLDPYDVVIKLQPLYVPRHHQAVDITQSTHLPVWEEYTESQGKQYIPVTGYDPVQCYIKQLREAYSEFALFFHDIYGADIIGVVWKPSAFQRVSFKTSTVSARMPVEISKGKETQLITNVESILESFRTLGQDLVTDIQTNTEKWTI